MRDGRPHVCPPGCWPCRSGGTALNAVGIPAHVQQALRQLEVADAGAASELMDGFKTAAGRISFRMKQAFGYWKELPWALLVIMRPWVEYFSSSEEAMSCQKECRTMALLHHDATVNKAALGAACLPCFVSEKCHMCMRLCNI